MQFYAFTPKNDSKVASERLRVIPRKEILGAQRGTRPKIEISRIKLQ